MRNYFKIASALLLLSFCLNQAKAQDQSPLSAPLDSSRVWYFSVNRLDSNLNREYKYLDTAFFGIQHYNPLMQNDNFYQNLGNIGLAHQSISFNPRLTTGFDYGIHSFDEYLLNDQKVIYYSGLKPYTELKYSTGSRKEQLFRVMHTHGIKNRVFIAARFNIINAFGRPSFRQKADDINSWFTAYYFTKNKRYGVFAHFYYNRVKDMENGGILVDSVYEQFREGRNYSQFKYGLTEALNTYKESAWYLKNILSLDFRKSDSTGRLHGFSLGHFTLSTSYRKPRFSYTDEGFTADYYPFFFGSDSNTVIDSVYYKMLENTLCWTSNAVNKKNITSPFRFFASAKHSYIEVHPQNENTYISQLKTSAGFILRLLQQIDIFASAEYVMGDANNADMKGSAGIDFLISKKKNRGILSLNADFVSAELPWMAKNYYSTYYRWENHFDKQQTLSANLSYRYPRLKTTLQWTNINNLLYWDRYGMPHQYNGNAVNIFSLFVRKTFVFGKFSIDNKAIAQYSSDDQIIHLPLFTGGQSYAVTFKMFKKALGVQTGLDLWYNTPYYADAWNPATRQFTLQYQEKTGNYLYIDVFLNLKIKRAFLFLKLDHAAAGLMGYKYYSTPHYPAADRAFKFGVSWIFHD